MTDAALLTLSDMSRRREIEGYLYTPKPSPRVTVYNPTAGALVRVRAIALSCGASLDLQFSSLVT